MIKQEEIHGKAKEFEINSSNVQRDYIFGWFLHSLFTISSLKETFFLKGGNALRKGYFENTRYSNDLDFGIPGDISETQLLIEINKICEHVQAKTGVTFVRENNKVEEKFTATEAPIPGLKVYEAKVYFKDFSGQPRHITLKISMDITRYDKVMLPLQTVNLIHPYSDADEIACTITCMKVEEIIATKLKCLLQRQHAPDLYDYVYSIKLLGGTLNQEEVVQTFIRKTIFSRNPHVVKKILASTSFDFFRSTWKKGVLCAKQVIIEVEEAISSFVAHLEVLFGIYSDNGYVQFVYFGPELRTAILKAGRDQTLLKIRYNGSERMIEPYALKYMERRNGSEREYFYAFNKSGGSNPPGMRTLVPEGFQSIENTEEKFTPQFPIELSKSGETPENPYLFDPNKPLKAPSTRRIGYRSRRTYTGIKYTYKCSSCGKTFTKRTQSSTLGQHKNKSGYMCGSRYGYYVKSSY